MRDGADVEPASTAKTQTRLRQAAWRTRVLTAFMARHIEAAGGGLEAAIEACGRTARFAETERWVSGPAWTAQGGPWLVAAWALKHGYIEGEVAAAYDADRLRGVDDHAIAPEAQQRVGGRTSQHGDASLIEAAAPQSVELAAARARRARIDRLRRGREQVAAMDILLHDLIDQKGESANTIGNAADAARYSVWFAASERWVSGAVWMTMGVEMVLSRWALQNGVTYDEVSASVYPPREPASDPDLRT
jgi:hypothetical protein